VADVLNKHSFTSEWRADRDGQNTKETAEIMAMYHISGLINGTFVEEESSFFVDEEMLADSLYSAYTANYKAATSLGVSVLL
jgi:hypothetical protein